MERNVQSLEDSGAGQAGCGRAGIRLVRLFGLPFAPGPDADGAQGVVRDAQAAPGLDRV